MTYAWVKATIGAVGSSALLGVNSRSHAFNARIRPEAAARDGPLHGRRVALLYAHPCAVARPSADLRPPASWAQICRRYCYGISTDHLGQWRGVCLEGSKVPRYGAEDHLAEQHWVDSEASIRFQPDGLSNVVSKPAIREGRATFGSPRNRRLVKESIAIDVPECARLAHCSQCREHRAKATHSCVSHVVLWPQVVLSPQIPFQ